MKHNSHICRCCGRSYALADLDGYIFGSVCPDCGWEEDYSPEEEYSPANHASLQEYRMACSENIR